jgi:hypothetical protein
MAYIILNSAKNVLGEDECREWANCGCGEEDLPLVEESLLPALKDDNEITVKRPGNDNWREVMPVVTLCGNRLFLETAEVVAWAKKGAVVYAISEEDYEAVFC